jgi:hypothetical protein
MALNMCKLFLLWEGIMGKFAYWFAVRTGAIKLHCLLCEVFTLSLSLGEIGNPNSLGKLVRTIPITHGKTHHFSETRTETFARERRNPLGDNCSHARGKPDARLYMLVALLQWKENKSIWWRFFCKGRPVKVTDREWEVCSSSTCSSLCLQLFLHP